MLFNVFNVEGRFAEEDLKIQLSDETDIKYILMALFVLVLKSFIWTD